jgi:hypothetical protein
VEIKCGLPLYFKCKYFQKVVDYLFFEHVEIVNHSPLVKVFDLYISLAMSISREEIIPSMEEVLVALRHMQEENQTLCESIAHLQGNQTSVMLGNILKEPQISLSEKFNNTHSKF